MMLRYHHRWLVVGLALAILALFPGCDDEEESAGASTATPEPEATATAEPSRGTLVFLRGSDLWVASADGETLRPRAVTSASLGAGYAGFVRGSDGSVDLYYISQLTEATETGGDRTAEFGLYRVAIDGGEAEELLRFSSAAYGLHSYPENASVSPDGEHIVYADVEGLSLLDLSSGVSSRLLEHGTCAVSPEAYGPDLECYSYSEPQWDPNGNSVIVWEGLYEEALLILLDPFESPVRASETEFGSGRPGWSPDAERLCIWQGFGLAEARTLVYEVATGESTDILATLPLPTPGPGGGQPNAYGCGWSEDGRLAAGYAGDFFEETAGRIVILDSRLRVLEESEPIEHLEAVAAWLPDGSGIVFNRRDQQAEIPEAAQLPPGIFDLQRGVVDLPFEADLVLGVIP